MMSVTVKYGPSEVLKSRSWRIGMMCIGDKREDWSFCNAS